MKRQVISIKQERLKRGWTKSELAKRIGVTPPIISRIEAGENRSPKTLFKIAKELRIPIERLIA